MRHVVIRLAPALLLAFAACGDAARPTAPRAEPVADVPTENLFSGATSYRVVDLGTFGTPQAQAFGINEFGAVIGRYGVAPASQRSFRWTAHHGMTDLGDFNGQPFLVLRQNNLGQLAGWIPRVGGQNAVVWTPQRGFETIDDTVHYFSIAWGVNDFGQVVGNRRPIGTFNQSAYIWSKRDGLLEIPSFGEGTRAGAFDVNARGQVVGSTFIAANCCAERAFLWERASGMQLLPSLGGNSYAIAISLFGKVVGHSDLRPLLPGEPRSGTGVAGGPPTHAFVWHATTGMVDLGTLGGTNSVAWAVDYFGNVYGWAHNAAGARRAFKWSAKTGMIDLGTLGGPSSETGNANLLGVIAGMAADASGANHAVLFVPKY